MKKLLLTLSLFLVCLAAHAQQMGGGGGLYNYNSSTGAGGAGTVTSITAGSSNIVVSPSTLTTTGTIDLPSTISVTGLTATTVTGTTLNLNGALKFTGTAAAPTTGISSPTAASLELTATGAAAALYASSTNSVGVNTTTPAYPLDIEENPGGTGFALGLVNSYDGAGGGGGPNLITALGPNTTTGQQIGVMYFGRNLATKNVGQFSFNYQGNGSSNNSITFNFFGSGNGLTLFANGNVLANSTGGSVATASPDSFDVTGGIGLITTTATIPTTGIYSAGSGSLNFSTTGGSQLAISNAGVITANTPNYASCVGLNTNSSAVIGCAAATATSNVPLRGSGGTPTCGTGCASINAGSTDSRGSMVSSSSVSSVALSFSTTLGFTPTCTISDSNTTATADLNPPPTPSGFTVSLASALTSVTIYWICVQ